MEMNTYKTGKFEVRQLRKAIYTKQFPIALSSRLAKGIKTIHDLKTTKNGIYIVVFMLNQKFLGEYMYHAVAFNANQGAILDTSKKSALPTADLDTWRYLNIRNVENHNWSTRIKDCYGLIWKDANN